MLTTTKTAISLPPDLLRRFDSLANARSSSRSALVAEAMEALLKRHAADEITRSYNDACDLDAAEKAVVQQMRSTQRRHAKDRW